MQRLLLILDLDETLVYANEKPLDRPWSFTAGGYYVYQRPHVGTFLLESLSRFDLAVWSSAGRDYVVQVVENLFEEPRHLKFVWTRERCTLRFDSHSGAHFALKDLKKVKRAGYDLSRVIVVDDSPEKLGRHYGNHVRVAPYGGEPEDDELMVLLPYLERLDSLEDVRPVEKRGWRVRPTR